MATALMADTLASVDRASLLDIDLWSNVSDPRQVLRLVLVQLYQTVIVCKT